MTGYVFVDVFVDGNLGRVMGYVLVPWDGQKIFDEKAEGESDEKEGEYDMQVKGSQATGMVM